MSGRPVRFTNIQFLNKEKALTIVLDKNDNRHVLSVGV